MSPINALEEQRRLVEVGRIRLGEKGERGRPVKLSEFRLTSASRELLEQAARLYGGEVDAWNDPAVGPQFQLATTARELDVLIPPGPSVCSQWMELWSGGGCQRRCDGIHELIGDTACKCPEDPEDRAELAAKGKACKATTRLSLILPRVGGLGVWRLESHGWNAAVELPATLDLARAIAAGLMMPATLALDARTKKRNGETNRFVVPVLRLNVSVAALSDAGAVQLGAGAAAALPSAELPALPAGAPSPADPLDARRLEIRERLKDMPAKTKQQLLKQAGITQLPRATEMQLDALEMLLDPGSPSETSIEAGDSQAPELEEADLRQSAPPSGEPASTLDPDALVPMDAPDRAEFLNRLASHIGDVDARKQYFARLIRDHAARSREWSKLTWGEFTAMCKQLTDDSWHRNRLSRFRSSCAARNLNSNEVAASHGIDGDVAAADVATLQELIDLVETGAIAGASA